MRKILVSFSMLALLLAGCGGPMTDHEKEIAACSDAQLEIMDMLKNPSSAKFPSCASNTIEEISTDKYRVEGYVDAENSFGGTAREYYTCNVRLQESDNSYYISCSWD